MIAQLAGTVDSIAGNSVIVDVQGVGYEVYCTSGFLMQTSTGSEVRVVVYTDVREDSIQLYGFADELEKQLFRLLISVKGVGARSGCEILSCVDTKRLLKIVAAGDLVSLQSVKGIGKKTAERIVVELKDKMSEFLAGSAGLSSGLAVERVASSPADEAVEALCALGFSRGDAERAVGRIAQPTAEAGDIVKEALQFI